MIHSLGVKYIILGHSERREYFNETNTDLRTKVDLSLSNNLDVIFCCGESLKQRESGVHFDWIKSQIVESLFHLTEEEFSKLAAMNQFGLLVQVLLKLSQQKKFIYKICHLR